MESLLVSDPRRFMDHVLRADPQERWDGLETLDDIALCEILRYGIYNDAATIPELKQFYSRYFLPVPVERRSQVYGHVAGMVENVDFVSFNAFLPFVVGDDDRMIVATAVIDYVSLAPVPADDPMCAVREIVRMIGGSALQNEGAAFGALLHMGDPRVCRLIWPLRDTLDIDSLKDSVNCQTPFISACTVDFYIDWLEGLVGDIGDGAFGLAAAGLASVKRKSGTSEVFTGLRPFPFTKTMTAEEIRAIGSQFRLPTTWSASRRASMLSNAPSSRPGSCLTCWLPGGWNPARTGASGPISPASRVRNRHSDFPRVSVRRRQRWRERPCRPSQSPAP
jgi:hypothetical protein